MLDVQRWIEITWSTCMHGVMKACGFDRCSESLQLTACDVTFACCRAMIGDLQGSRRSVHLSILLFILMCVSAKPAVCCGSNTQLNNCCVNVQEPAASALHTVPFAVALTQQGPVPQPLPQPGPLPQPLPEPRPLQVSRCCRPWSRLMVLTP